ncbi:MAG: NAD(P)H-dependent oxidoreductase [Eubacteriales bacterium]|nr:NAD(P)H-dependent oxidoreductase [Eubacteriales bacterium]
MIGGWEYYEKIFDYSDCRLLRKDSYNMQLAKAAQTAVGDRAEFEILDYSDVPFMNQDIEYPAPEAVQRVRNQIKATDGVWFFTPEYNHFFPGF